MSVRTKRIYEAAESGDGMRILVDRLWPRGVSKEDAALDRWIKDLAPFDELRRWFDHDPERWDEFSNRYKDELAHQQDVIDELRELAEDETVNKNEEPVHRSPSKHRPHRTPGRTSSTKISTCPVCT